MTGDIAVVGLDGRFPGAADPAAFWDLLMRGGHGLTDVPADRWPRADFFDPAGGPGRTNTTVGGFLTDADAFDHEFFGISPREAAAMDPQQRLMLQTAWRAFEDAGLDPRRQAGTNTGVFVGVMSNEWAQLTMTDYDRVTPHRGTGNGYCLVANRVSYHLDLRGPSWAVDSACSSSLVAAHQACVALRAGECDQALVGGVNVVLTPALNIFYSQAGLSAADGQCRPFSRDARGIVRGEAVAALVLRRLDDAVAAGLPVYAVIRGGAVNSDGRSNGLTAPNRWSQQAVIAEAYRRAGVAAAEVVAVEAHGTGTVLGDLVEANALGGVHGVPRSEPCAIGSVKANIGHVEGAAGVAALVKMVLALHHGTVPASRHARTENPELRLADKGLRLLSTPLRLRGRHAIVGVSSFGLGGTNAHLVLGSAPTAPRPPAPAAAPPAGDPAPAPAADPAPDAGAPAGPTVPGVLTVSADGPEGLRRAADLLARDVAGTPPRLLGQLCWTSNAVKSTGRHRLAFVPADHRDAVERLRAIADGDDTATGRARSALSLGWLVTGQGAQHPGMTAALYATSGAYRRALHEADDALTPLLGASVLDTVRDRTATTVPARLAQPALFAVGYALGRVLDDLGVRPDWLLGHSLGEFAVAVHAGALTLAGAAHLVALRSRLMARLPSGGGMLAARCPVATVAPLLADEPLVDLAAVNGPRDVVCAGDAAGLARVAEALRGQRVAVRPLDVPYAFHSPLMEPILDEFARGAADVEVRPARRPVYSGLRGRLLGPDELMDAGYWTAHLREPVRFADAATAALAAAPSHLVEVGPRRVLSPLLRSMPAGREVPTLTACPGPEATGAELWELTARLHRDGLDPDWTVLYEPEQRVLRRLSPYPFATRARFWVGATRPEPAPPMPEPAHLRPLPAARPAPPPGDHLDDEVLELVADVCGYPRHQVARDASLHEQLGYDSIMVVQLKERIEARWGIPVDVRELLSEVSTPGQLVDHLRTRVVVTERKGHRD